MSIREANVNDINEILPLMEELGYPCDFQEMLKRYKDFISNIGYGVAVYEINGTVVSFIAWSKSLRFVSGHTKFHIEGLVVKEEFRNQGIGKKMIYFLEQIAVKNSPAIIDLTSGIRRIKYGTHEFYKNLGYKNEGDKETAYFRKEL